MSRKRTYRDLEDDLDRDRAQLGSIFDSLFSRSTIDLLMREAMQTVRANGGVRETAESVVRRNPVAVGVVGLGLAWLALGGNRGPSRVDEVEERAEGFARRLGRGADRARRVVRDEADAIENTDWMDVIDRLRAKASARLHDLEEDARAYRDDIAAGLSDRADDARDYMAERAEILSDLAEDMRERFAEGLEDFSAAAQKRIVQAREEAYAARLKAQDALGKGGREAKRIVEDHPMVSAAVALALGAAIGTAVYRNKRGKEDEMEDFVKDVKKDAKKHWRRR
ncbi:hypothetical protein [Falsirhodobacter halotolerans]|uniref:hypothetical protein n=1 Tax=Falsirhodobacter halotolerans TaxID=1146892 RepID=UPI001FD5EC0A|nr:hypothetical protein [Falsirhodobacter halotolerans]MCJ8140743.1 hypothetical protein [Falsirhodobacter halotolerans]